MIRKYITYNGKDNSTSLPGKSQHSPCCVRAELWRGVMVGKCHGISVWNCIEAKTLWVFGNKLGWPFRFHGPLKNVCAQVWETVMDLDGATFYPTDLEKVARLMIIWSWSDRNFKLCIAMWVLCEVFKDYFWSSFRGFMRLKWAAFLVCTINIIVTIHFKRHSGDYYFDTKI